MCDEKTTVDSLLESRPKPDETTYAGWNRLLSTVTIQEQDTATKSRDC
jgi:hypothetical protein